MSAIIITGGAGPAASLPDDSGQGNGLALLRADKLTYDPENEVVSAEGHVEIDYRAEHLHADRITYDQKADRVTADGNIILIDKDGNVFFTDHAVLTDAMREGVINKVGILFGKNARIAANSAVRHKETATVFTRAVYSPCNICKEDPKRPPLWQLKARRVTHDKVDREVYYRDARLEVFGFPIAYTPYFSHPDPTVKRKSGFLSPSFGKSTVLGSFVTVPYYWAMSDSRDATITPTFESKDGLHLRGEYRQRTRNGQFTVDGSVVRADEVNDLNETTGRKDLRGHLFAEGSFELNPIWRWGFDIQTTTDDTYLRRYKIADFDRLENHVYLQGIEDRNYLSVDGYAFRDLRAGDTPGQTPFVAPVVEGSYSFSPRSIGGIATLNGSLLSLTRTNGVDLHRASGSFGWERQFVNGLGQLITGFASVRADAYQANDLNTGGLAGVDNSTTQGRVLPQAGVEWRWPFVRNFNKFRNVIEPIVQFIYAPKGGNFRNIPNEDSQSLEFDESNLFSRNRFPGLDRWEDGPRLNYGLRTAVFWGTDSSAELIIGQSHRFLESSPFATGSGLDEQNSDIVGSISIRPRKFIEFSHRFRLDHDDLSYKRNETGISLFFWRITGNASYTSITGNDTTLQTDSLKAITASTQIRLSDHWNLNAATQRDLTNNRTVFRQAGVGYLNECVSFNLVYRQDYTSDRDIRPSSSVTFQIRLVNLG